jgi:uncharacterized protein YbjQ (UPF0145 family)
MAECAECGKKFGFLEAGTNGLCTTCAYLANVDPDTLAKIDANIATTAEIEAIALTTETVINSPVQKRLKIIMSSVECVFEVKIPKAESELLYDLKRRAFDLGANAVVGVNIQFIETYNVGIGVGEFKKFRMIAYGTAMIIEEVG